jgi:hypothetical protein
VKGRSIDGCVGSASGKRAFSVCCLTFYRGGWVFNFGFTGYDNRCFELFSFCFGIAFHLQYMI